MQVSLCSKQKQMQDYFKSTPRAPIPSKEPRAVTPIKDVSFKMVADATKDVSHHVPFSARSYTCGTRSA